MSTTVKTKASTIPRFFDDLSSKTNEPLLHNRTGTIEWNIHGVGRWWVGINRGAIHVSQSPQDADVIVSCDADTFLKVINHQETLVTATFKGDMRGTGNVALALSFQRLLD